MITAAQLRVVVGADVAGALGGLGQVNRAIGGTAGFFSRAASTAAGFIGGALGLGALQNVAGAATDSIFGFNASLEQSRTSFGVMLGSGAKANAFLGQLQSFALATPFEFPQLVSASQRMLAFGFASEQVIPLLTDIGNVASASPSGFAQGLERISLALGQMQAKGRVQGDELLQLQEAGVNTGEVFAIMARQTGLSVDALRKAQTAGKLSAATFTRAFQTFSQARFGGLMEKQSQTFTGAVSNIKDGLRGALATGFLPLFEAVRGLAVRFADFLQTAQFQQWVAQLQSGVSQVVTWLGTSLPAAWAILQPKLAELQAWFQDTLPVATASLAEVWNTTLRPALDSVFSVLAPVAGAFAQLAGAVANEAFLTLGPTLVGAAAAIAVISIPSLIAAAAAFATMAAAAGPLYLLAIAVAVVARTVYQNRDIIGSFLHQGALDFAADVRSILSWAEVLNEVMTALRDPVALGKLLASGTLSSAISNWQMGVSQAELARRAAGGPIFGANGTTPLPPLPAAGAPGGVNAPLVVNFTGDVNANDPADLEKIARVVNEAQLQSLGINVGVLMPEGS